MSLIEIAGLGVTIENARGRLEILRDVSFSLGRGHILGIVGESGSGKTMTTLAIMGLLPEAAHAVGSIKLDGHELLGLDDRALRRLRGDRLAMIFQEPMTALNPLQTVGQQVAEPLRLHRRMNPGAAAAEARRLLARVRLPEPDRLAEAFPHQLSGGQRQRVMIAMALACGPDLLLADEPTTALDVTIQAEILDLLVELVEALGMALILISHDLAAIAETADEVLVMYGGTIVERASVAALLRHRAHPYTQGLFAARPALGSSGALRAIPGSVPDLAALPPGCRFADRCALALPACSAGPPPLTAVAPGHAAACIRLDAARITAEAG